MSVSIALNPFIPMAGVIHNLRRCLSTSRRSGGLPASTIETGAVLPNWGADLHSIAFPAVGDHLAHLFVHNQTIV